MTASIAIATTSYIRTPTERNTVLTTVRALNRTNHQTYITNLGPLASYWQPISQLPNIHMNSAPTLRQQLQHSCRLASQNHSHLFYLHTDKLDLANKHIQKICQFYQDLDPRTILIVSRTIASFQSYPAWQRKCETIMNFCQSILNGAKGDYYYGPKIFPSTLVPYLLELKGNLHFTSFEAYIYALARKLNYPLVFYPLPAQAPTELLSNWKAIIYRLRVMVYQWEGTNKGHQQIL